MKTITIKHRYTSAVFYSTDVADDDPNPIRTAVVRAVETGADLGGADLRDANLRDANLSNANLRDANLSNANLSDANLRGADLGGADLRDANLRGADLGGADLSGADLGGANLRGANLRGAYLIDADLIGANLSDANLSDANLSDAYLRDANLGGAYLRDADLGGANLGGANLGGARNVPEGVERTDPSEPYARAVTDEQRKERAAKRIARFRERHPEVPVIDRLDAKILEAVTSTGKLNMSQWHTCETTHCRAGWAITLAGESGKALEKEHGPHRAGAMIYSASTGRIPHFFASTERALEDIKRCAEES